MSSSGSQLSGEQSQSDKSNFHRCVREVWRSLIDAFDRPTLGNKEDPLDELFYIILSNRTPPERHQNTYLSLKSAFPRADLLSEIEPKEVAETIQSGGLQNKKARAITAIARELKKEFGRVTLDPICEMSTGEAEIFLASLPGVSTKTARCVLMYSLNRFVFPVDRHCRRISARLGWIPKDAHITDALADKLQEGIPPNLRRDLHVGMVVLGRRICLSQNPRCSECPLLKYCPTGQKLTP